MIARIAAVAAIVVAVVVVAVVFVGGGEGYTVKADFQNASQLVIGDDVQVSGVKAGQVKDIQLTPNGQAQITMSVDGSYAPLHRGTIATIRQTSLSGIANRYVNLDLPSRPGPTIPKNGVIGQDHTVSVVELDEIFGTFGPTERDALSSFIRGAAAQIRGKGALQNQAWKYLNPAVISSARLFNEIDRDKPQLRRFLRQTAGLVSDLASRRQDISGLVDNLSTTTGALASRRGALQLAIQRLPGFMRQANTTFVNLRTTLNDLQPVVDQSKPVAIRLHPFLNELRTFAANARPTVHDTRFIIRRPGPANDLIELVRSSVPVRDAALGSLRPLCLNGSGTFQPQGSCSGSAQRQRPGAFPAATSALRTATPELGFARPYAEDLTGWFNDFSDTGYVDATGGVNRASLNFNQFTLLNFPGGPQNLFKLLGPLLGTSGSFDPGAVQTRLNDRCPGSMERQPASNRLPNYPGPNFPCNPGQKPEGP